MKNIQTHEYLKKLKQIDKVANIRLKDILL